MLNLFLSSGVCPTSFVSSACWSHPGSYLGRMSIQTQTSRILIESGNATIGFSSVMINTAELTVGDRIDIKRINSTDIDVTDNIHYVTSHVIKVDVGLYQITIHNSDKFLNLHAIKVKNWNSLTSAVQPHGILGQTWHTVAKGTVQQVAGLEGLVEDYAEQNNDLWGTETVYNKFNTAHPHQ